MNDYEKAREERIRINKERMAALNLQNLAATALPVIQPKPKPLPTRGLATTKRKRLSEELPRRRSARLQGETADGSEIAYERNGEIIVYAAEGKVASGSGKISPPPPQERHPKGDVVFKSNNASADTDESFLRLLANLATPYVQGSMGKSGKTKKNPKPLAPTASRLSKLNLAEIDVAKIVKNSITHMAFHPSTDALLLAAADKRGSVGLWHVDAAAASLLPARAEDVDIDEHKKEDARTRGSKQSPVSPVSAQIALDSPAVGDVPQRGEDEQDGAFDGVLSFSGLHYQYISGLKWAGHDPSLFTCAYDGSLRRLDVEKGSFSLVWGDEEMEYSCFDVSADAATAMLGDNHGHLDVIDVRSGQRVHDGLHLHDRKINTVHLEPSAGTVVVTASTDSSVCLWDMRKLGPRAKPVATANHRQTCQAAYFAPDGSQCVVSTSFDNTVRCWDGKKKLEPILSIRHDNQTGRWVMPFRAVWAPEGDAVIVGNMHRFVDILDAKTGELTGQLSGEGMTAIPARNCVHPTLPVLAAGTASGRVHVYR
jgi:WD repeat-containing protein 76